jgi:AcrR family transcriptional regulator
MASGVKRTYDSSRRQAQSRATKAQVVDAARALFVDRGYPTTTIESIGDAADVPLATIYRLFRSKVGILKSVIDVAFGGDDEQVEFGDRYEVRAARDEPDPERLVDAFARIARALMERSAPILGVLATAATVDPEAARLLDVVRRQRLTGQSRIADALVSRKALRPELSRSEAVDVIYALLSPDMHRVLTEERRWSPEQYEEWLAQALKRLLLAPTTRRSSRSGAKARR